ncbi:MAG TPA: glycosyltransferase family 2 protein [Candidatus Limnocylindria bacterium]|nr:glycosyltransferase family 2 protein [Candidatus Limnocylindria bacterium]
MSDTGQRPAVSFVVPVYNEQGNVDSVHADITRAARALGLPYEIVFVNDGSTDDTIVHLERLVATDPVLRVVDLDGNFGEAAALSAGFTEARGELVCSLDGDGQNDPGDLPALMAALGPERSVVTGFRRHREGNFFTRVLPSRIANALIALVTGVKIHDCGCSLKLYRRRVLDGVALPHGMHRFLPAILGVKPSEVVEVPVNDRPRGSGSSHYGLSRTFIVLRDLVGLRLVLRRHPGRATARALRLGSLAAAVLSVSALATARPVAAVVCMLATAGLAAAWYDVIRFVEARERGVYRVRRVLDGSTVASRTGRDRILGGDAAAHAELAPRSAPNGAV